MTIENSNSATTPLPSGQPFVSNPEPVPPTEPAAADTATPEVVVTPEEGNQTPDPAAPTDPDPKSNQPQDWAIKRINELTAKRYEAERKEAAERTRAEAAEKVAAELLARQPNPDPTNPQQPAAKPGLTQEDVERLANEKAAQLAAAATFNKACDNVYDAGTKEFKDWDESIKNLALVGALGANVSPEFLETAIELKDSHKVLHHLGKHLDEAEKIIKLSPKKMAMELARLEATLNAPAPAAVPAPLSNAPAPVIPLSGKSIPGSLSIDDPNLSTADFMALREKAAQEKRDRYRR